MRAHLGLLAALTACGPAPGEGGGADAAAVEGRADAREDDVGALPDGAPEPDGAAASGGPLDCAAADEVVYPAGAFVPTDLQVLGDGFLLLGWGTPDVTGNARAWLARTDPAGTLLWQQWVGDGGPVRTAEAGRLQGDGRVRVVGRASYDTGSTNGWFAHVAPDGEVTDSRVFGAGPTVQHILTDMVAVDGGLVAVGDRGTTRNTVWVVKLDAGGATVWDRTYPSAGWTTAYDVVALDGGDLALVAYDFADDARLLRLSSTGDVVLDRTYPLASWDEARALAVLPGGDLILAGAHAPVGWVARVDAVTGDVVWEDEVAPLADNLSFTSVDVDAAGNVIAVGRPWWDGAAQAQVVVWSADGTRRDEVVFGDHHAAEEVRWLAGGRFAVMGGLTDATGYRGGAWLRLGACVPGIE